MARFWATIVLAFMTAGIAQAGGAQVKEKDKAKVKEKEKVKEKIKVKEKEKTKAKEKVKFQPIEVKGVFTNADPKDPQRNGPSQTHVVKLKAGLTYTIDMISPMLDSYLRLQDPRGKQLDEDDDSGGGLNSRIIFNCGKDGDYKVVCTTFGAGQNGSYTLKIKSNLNTEKPPSTAHALLLAARAPDFKGEFAVNGPAIKLSDLKGKVVLLAFWEVRSSTSVALLPKLNEWHKTFKKDGLELVSVTYFPSDINQKLSFDKESGRLATVKQADHKSDQTLLGAFAAYHKIEHRVMALSQKDALDAFDVYAVNSLPQLVLIDRKGMVRLIHVSGTRNSADVESEIQKVIAEK